MRNYLIQQSLALTLQQLEMLPLNTLQENCEQWKENTNSQGLNCER